MSYEEIYPKIETLFRQAPLTTNRYMLEAEEYIDKEFGDHYAQDHPELVGAFMQTCAMNFLAGVLVRVEHQIAAFPTD